MRQLCLTVIRTYRRWVSPFLRPACRFEPTCSEYATDAISRYGVWRGLGLTCLRLAKCHPFHPGGCDPVK
ncbi:MAG: membrane protein insertion efficiency factor YidD [Nitrospirota bacterium]